VLLHHLKQQREDERRRRSDVIRRKVFRLAVFRRANLVGCFVALPYEVQTWRMIEEMLARGKRVAVPVTARRGTRLRFAEIRDPARELSRGPLGVLEPHPRTRQWVRVQELDLLLVPGLAFDRRGQRLGHGQGYFDRLLERVPKTTPTVGLAFRFQLLECLPTAAHDRAVQTVVTA
jgi:5-formyltetrahydrofolate cyclo-ligase